MAVSQLQFNTASTGNTATTTLSVSQSSNSAIGNTLVAVVVSNMLPNTAGTPWTIIAQQGGPPYMTVYRFTATGALTYVFNVQFNVAALASVALITTNAASVSGVTFGNGSGNVTVSAQGTTPPYWAPQAGDLPYGFFASSTAATPTTQSGWTQLANLNSTAGYSSQLQVQQGPATTTTPQSPTAQTTWSGAAGFTSLGAILTMTAAGPYDMTSQGVLETLGTGTPNDHTSQMALETIGQGVPNEHTSQLNLEIAAQDTALMRGSQIYIELLIPLEVRISQDVLETLDTGTPNVRSSQMLLEVLFSSQGQRRRTLDEEWFNV